MRTYNRKFTIIEIMAVIFILVVLISIGISTVSKVTRSQMETKAKAELKMLLSACHQYKDRYGDFPDTSGDTINFKFCNHLAKIPITAGYDGSRYFFIDYRGNNFNLNGDTALDPYDQPYQYRYTDNKIEIWSLGLDPNDDSDDVY